MPPETMPDELNRKHWLSRRLAKTFFKFASFMTLVLIAFLAAMMAGIVIAGEGRFGYYVNHHWWMQAVGFVLGVVGAPCAIGLWMGMLSHWASTNESRKGVRAAWLFLLIFGNWLAALLYYFVSYRKQTAASA
jgi:hypothetical protein